MNFGETGESSVTFDNLSDGIEDSPSSETMDADEISVPEVDLDKQEPAGSRVADEEKSDEPKASSENKIFFIVII